MKSRWYAHPLFRKLLIIPPLAVGIIGLWLLTTRDNQPDRKPEREEAVAMRVLTVQQVDVLPRALGYGTAAPGRLWEAVSEVKGQVTKVHPDLKPGAIVKRNTIVLEIDRTEYQLTVDRLTSEIKQAEVKLQELETTKLNYGALKTLEEKSLDLAVKQLNRLKIAKKQNAVTQTAIDEQEGMVVAKKQSLQSVLNSLSLLPVDEKSTKASIAVKKVNLAQARLDLDRTKIKAPFDCRIGPVTIEPSQFLAAGQKLFEAHSIDVTEVEAQVSLPHLRILIGDKTRKQPKSINMQTLRDVFRIKAAVRFQAGPHRAVWPAKFARIREALESDTQTLGIVVAIEKPYERAVPGKRPPPLKGIFCEVEFQGILRPSRIIVPRSAIHDGHVYVLDAQSRLHRREVKVEFSQANFSVVSSGLNQGETLVVSDPRSGIDGMLVKPVMDKALLEEIKAEAKGTGDLR